MPERFTATLRTESATPVLELVGEIDGEAEAALLRAWDQLDRDTSRVVLDFGRAAYINSTGLALIVGLLARARAARREVHAVGLSDHYREIFEITRLADFVSLHAERAAAFG